MKICIKTHQSETFGEIPEGSIWADDSPHIGNKKCFAVLPDPEPEVEDESEDEVA